MTPTTVTVVFPWQCAVPVNQRTAFHRGRHKLSTKYRRGLERATQEAIRQTAGIRPVEDVPFRAELAVWLPDRRKRDLDGLAKLPLDACEGFIYEDDNQVRDLRIYAAGLDREEPRLVLTVTPMEEAA